MVLTASLKIFAFPPFSVAKGLEIYYYVFYKIRNTFNVSQCENYSPQKKYRSHCYSLLCSIHLPTTSEYLNKWREYKVKKSKPFIISIRVYFRKIITIQRRNKKIENHTQNFFSNSYLKTQQNLFFIISEPKLPCTPRSFHFHK